MYIWTVAPERAPDRPERVEISFDAGVPVAVDGEPMSPVALLETLNELAARHGVGRADLVENRLVGMKSRGVYETPGGTLLHTALRDLESITIDRRAEALGDQLAQRWADMVYEGRWWTPEREALQAASDVVSQNVTGTVRLRLYKGSARVVSRSSPVSLYRGDLASFGHAATYDHADAAGFIRLFGLPVRAAAAVGSAAAAANDEAASTGRAVVPDAGVALAPAANEMAGSPGVDGAGAHGEAVRALLGEVAEAGAA